MTAMAAGTAISAYSSIKSGQAAQESANYQAQQSLNEGAYAADAAKAQAEKIRKAGKTAQGAANASLSSSGVKLGEGTALEVQKSIIQNSEEDALTAMLSGKRATTSASEEAKMLGKAGDNAVTNSYYSAAGTVLQSGGSIAKGWKSTAKPTAKVG